ncbi:MAG: phosphatase PAP2 family protein [Bacteroidota bacterium]|nr:phosphatase PAP2 family protein [Bacteroidota bacterium]
MPPIAFFERLDKILFLLINHDSSYSYLDPVMLLMRNPFTWIPLYIFMAIFMFVKTGKREWQFILFSLTTVAITDSSSALIKNTVGRIRPCFDAEISGLVRHLVDCGGMYSFPSSHAANHFGMATFWFWSIYKITGKKWRWLWIWASLICYAQVYVGKHFPSDIAAGALLGIIIGIIMSKVFGLAWDSQFNWQQIVSFFNGKNLQPGNKSSYTTE